MRLGTYRLRDWFLLGPLAFAAVTLGVVGFERCTTTDCRVTWLGGAFVRTLLLIRPSENFTFNRDPWELVIAQFLMFALFLLAGLIGSIKLFVQNLRHDVHLARAQSMRGHVVVCGLGETGLEIVRGLRRAGQGVVAITREDSSEAVTACERLGVPVLSGDAGRAESLAQAGVHRARALVATTGSDATNLDIAVAAGHRLASRSGQLLVRPEIRAPWLIDAMAVPAAPIFDPALLVHPLRVQEIAARSLLGNAAFLRWPRSHPRIVLAGLGDLGSAILRHAALCSFSLPGVRPTVLCYDDAADAREAALRTAPWRPFLDLEIRPARFGPADDPTRAADWETIRTEFAATPPDAVIVAVRDDDDALEAAFGLRDALDRQRLFAVPVHVRTRRAQGLRGLLARMADRPFCPDRLAGFGDLGSLVAPAQLFDDEADRMARAVHAVYLAGATKTDPAAASWEHLAERFRRSNRDFADHLPVKLARAGLRLVPGAGPGAAFTSAEIESLAEAEHERWSRVLRAAGWRAGPTRDEAARTHPLLVPWQTLPDEVRARNRAMVADIPRIAEVAGLMVRRLVRIDPATVPPGPDAIPLLTLDLRNQEGWRTAETLGGQRPIIVQASGLAEASPQDLARIASEFPRATAAVEVWVDPPALRSQTDPIPCGLSP